MPRRVAKNSRSHEVSSVGSVAVVSGLIRTIDDPDALDVKLSIWDTEVTMRADGAELGNWPAAAVTIRPLDAISFEFVAEGDRLIFVPNDPQGFAQHPIVSGDGTSKKRRRSRKPAKDKAADQPVQLRWDESTDAEERHRTKNTKQPKPSRAEKRAARRSSKADEKHALQEAVRRPKPTRGSPATEVARPVPAANVQPPASNDISSAPARAQSDPAPAPARIAVEQMDRGAVPAAGARTDPFGSVETPLGAEPKPARSRRTRTDKVKSERPKRQPKAPEERFRHRAWIRLIDLARQYDVFGFDRVQVTDAMRADPNHSHTWNSRVAPTSGPGKYICTACGAIRRSG